MKSVSNISVIPRSCGKCGNTIRMRADANSVLCTATLSVVDAGMEDICENYEERPEYSDDSFISPT